jgi:hypothetical protein
LASSTIEAAEQYCLRQQMELCKLGDISDYNMALSCGPLAGAENTDGRA